MNRNCLNHQTACFKPLSEVFFLHQAGFRHQAQPDFPFPVDGLPLLASSGRMILASHEIPLVAATACGLRARASAAAAGDSI